jgi:hypothetical protein
VAQLLNGLAELLRAQGKYDEAEFLLQQSLAISRKVCAIHLSLRLVTIPARSWAKSIQLWLSRSTA